MKLSDYYRENAENSLRLAATATSDSYQQCYKRMATAWSALTVEQDWLEEQVSRSLLKRREKAIQT